MADVITAMVSLERFSSVVTKSAVRMESLTAAVERVGRLQTSGMAASTVSSSRQLKLRAPEDPQSTASSGSQNMKPILQMMVQLTQQISAQYQSIVKLTQVIHHQSTTINQSIQRNQVMLTQNHQTWNQTNIVIQQAAKSQDEMNQSMNNGKSASTGLLGNMKKIALSAIDAGKKIAGMSDGYMQTWTKLNQMNDGIQTTEGFQNKLFAAANRSRSSYEAFSGAVMALGMTAKEAFSSNDELIGFSELAQQSFQASGASPAVQQSGMDQLAKAMSQGELGNADLLMLMKDAPMIAEAVTKFTNKSQDELKKMAAQGELTSELLIAAMFASADEINNQFNDMPQTFTGAAHQIRNTALQALAPILAAVNQLLNSPQGTALVNGIINTISVAGMMIEGLIASISLIGGAFQQIWSIAEPILAGIVGAFAFWALSQIPMLVNNLSLVIVKLWLMLVPILQSAIAWLAATWPILLIGALIGFVIYSLYKWSDAATAVIGFIGGIFGVLFGFLFNRFATFANVILSVAEFFANVFRDPAYAIQKLFLDLTIHVLEQFNNLARGIENIINKIPGLNVDMTSGLSSVLNKLEEARDNLSSKTDVVKLMRFEQIDYGEAFQMGQAIGQKTGSVLAGGVHTAVDAAKGLFASPDFGSSPSGRNGDSNASIDKINKVIEVGKISDTVNISSEDLKMMRELAEMKNIQNFVSLTPSVQVTTGPIQNGYDVDTIVARIETVLTEQITSSAQGVYA